MTHEGAVIASCRDAARQSPGEDLRILHKILDTTGFTQIAADVANQINFEEGMEKRPQRIVLIGFRGAGKTTIARRLAELLGWQYISTDDQIAGAVGMGIAEFVKLQGWKPFREKEAQIIRSLREVSDTVIDCGGGVVEDSSNMNILCFDSLVVWVKANLNDLYTRLKDDDQRPLLTQSDMRRDIEVNYRRREKRYRLYSQLIVNTSQQDGESICQYILNRLSPAD